MKEIEIPIPSVVLPELIGEEELKNLLQTNQDEESQVILHFYYTGCSDDNRIRIWNSTYLFVPNSSHCSKLVQAFHIPLYPHWLTIPYGQSISFTLIFTGLPKDCTHFHMEEKIPEPGGFIIKNIKRNKSDVYYIKLS